MLRLELGVERVGFVEALEHVAMPLLRPVHPSELLRHICPEQEISAFQRMLFRLEQIVGGLRKITTLPGYDAEVPKHLTSPRSCLGGRNRQQFVALYQRFVVTAPNDVELHFVDGEIELARVIAIFLERTSGLVVRHFCVGQLTKLHISQSDVVKHLRFVIAHSQRLIPQMTQAKSFEGPAYVTANHGDGAEILIDHRHERPVASELRLLARRRVDRRRLVQIARDLVDYPDDV